MFQAKNLEANIELTRKEMEEPTEVEIELKRRLGLMTDHLIQKQAQVCHSKHVFFLYNGYLKVIGSSNTGAL